MSDLVNPQPQQGDHIAQDKRSPAPVSPCSGDPGSYPEDGSSLAPPLLEDTSLHTAIDLKKRTEAASNKLDQVSSLHPWNILKTWLQRHKCGVGEWPVDDRKDPAIPESPIYSCFPAAVVLIVNIK